MYTDGYADAIRPQQIEQAISLAVVIRFNQPHMPIEDCAARAVEQVFCPCISRHDIGTLPVSLRESLVDSILGILKRQVCSAGGGCDVLPAERSGPGSDAASPPIAWTDEARHAHAGLASTVAQQRAEGGEDRSSANAARKRLQDEALDDALAQTFPASDPVALFIPS